MMEADMMEGDMMEAEATITGASIDAYFVTTGPFWSALTCQRFGRLRPVAAVRVEYKVRRNARSSVAEDDGDRSPRTKAVTGHRTPKSVSAFFSSVFTQSHFLMLGQRLWQVLVEFAAEKDLEVFVTARARDDVRPTESTVLKCSRSRSPPVLAETETRKVDELK